MTVFRQLDTFPQSENMTRAFTRLVTRQLEHDEKMPPCLSALSLSEAVWPGAATPELLYGPSNNALYAAVRHILLPGYASIDVRTLEAHDAETTCHTVYFYAKRLGDLLLARESNAHVRYDDQGSDCPGRPQALALYFGQNVFERGAVGNNTYRRHTVVGQAEFDALDALLAGEPITALQPK